MKFYDRQKEMEILEKHYQQIKNGAILDVLIGRRRIGKTELARHFIQNKKALYFFVSRKPLNSLLEEWSQVLKVQFPQLGEFSHLDNFLKSIFELAKKEKIIVVFDEYQNFKYIEPSAFSIFQKFFDEYKKQSKTLLILIGSVTTLMEKIFSDSKEPLFGRATRKVYLKPLSLPLVTEVLKDLKFKKPLEIFNLYSVFNGIPKYYVLFEEEVLQGASFQKILTELFLKPESLLKTEGEDLLKEEFGKDYQRYFEILSLIASGKTKILEIAQALKLPNTTINIYLSNLEKRFGLIERRLPILAKPQDKLGRYYLKDIFLIFWFRFIYRHLSWIERGADKLVFKIVKRDFPAYQGLIFEEVARNLILDLSLQSKKQLPFMIKKIGRFWDRQGLNEVDILALGEQKQNILLAECKLNPKRINLKVIEELKNKAQLPVFKTFKKKNLALVSWGSLNIRQKQLLNQAKILYINLEDYV